MNHDSHSQDAKNKQKAPNNTISMTFWFCSHLCLLIPTQNNKSTLSFSFCISAQKNLESMTETNLSAARLWFFEPLFCCHFVIVL